MDDLKSILERNTLDLDLIKIEKKEKVAIHKKIDDENQTKQKKMKELTKQVDKMGK
jgi:hypothetical protein